MKAVGFLLLFLFFTAPRTVLHECPAHRDAEVGSGPVLEPSCDVCGVPAALCDRAMECVPVPLESGRTIQGTGSLEEVEPGTRSIGFCRGPPVLV